MSEAFSLENYTLTNLGSLSGTGPDGLNTRSHTRWFCAQRTTVAPEHENFRPFMHAMPQIFAAGWGELIHNHRNQLRRLTINGEKVVVKSFAIPNIVNRIAYGLLRSSKAQRSYDYANLLRSWDIGSPEPFGWVTERCWGLFARSYYACQQSSLPYTYNDIIGGTLPKDVEERCLTAIAHTTALLHEHNCLHSDYSRGNILFGEVDGQVKVELIDLNRLRFRPVSVKQGCANLAERLPMTKRQRHIVAAAYAQARGADTQQCEEWMRKAQKERL